MKYVKYDNELKIGRKIYCTDRGDLFIKDLDEEYLTVWNEENQWLQYYSDIGKKLFFSKDESKIYGSTVFPQEKYAPYLDSKTLLEVKLAIRRQNEEFFNDMSYYDKEFYMEEIYLEDVENFLKIELKKIDGEVDGLGVVSSGNSKEYNTSHYKEKQNLEAKRTDLIKKKSKPYFGKIIEMNQQPVYIGEKAIEGKVVDSRNKKYANIWRQKEFYRNSLELIRNFIIVDGELIEFKDDYNNENADVVVGDEFLIKIIEYNRADQRMVSIAQTIRSDQHNVIMRPIEENFVVEGCAGSGKTMILLHRLSSIIFNEDEINERNLILISPNNVLDRESAEIVKDLEINKIKKGSINRLYREWIYEYIRNKRLDTSCLTEDFFIEAEQENISKEDLSASIYDKECVIDFENILLNILNSSSKEFKEFSLAKSEDEIIKKYVFKVFGGDIRQEEELYEFYKNVSDEYIDICKNLSIENVREKLKVLYDRLKNENNIIKSTYEVNIDKINYIKEKYAKIINSIDNRVTELEKELAIKLSKIYTKNKAKDEFEQMVVASRINNYRKDISNIEKELYELQRERKRIETQYNKEYQEVYPIKDYKNTLAEYNALSLFFNSKLLKGETIRTRGNEISTASTMFKTAIDFYKKYEKHIPHFLFDRNNSMNDFFRNNYLVMNRIKKAEQYAAGEIDNDEYILEILQAIIISIKKNYGLVEDIQYGFEPYYMLRGLQFVYGGLSNEFRLISVDEFQDCANVELELLAKLYTNSVFNLYGEVIQGISSKGIKAYKDIDIGRYLETYKFKINYRNGKNITEYINDKLNLEMDAIGIESTVTELSIDEFDNIKVDGKKRVALIVKSKKEYDLLNHNKENDNYFIDDNSVIKFDKLNVIPVKLAKGLEMEDVYVYDMGLSYNEKYVAYTRALNNLTIIS